MSIKAGQSFWEGPKVNSALSSELSDEGRIPDSPMLPAVARWLDGHTLAAVHLRRIANAAEAQINQDDREDYDPVLSARCRESLRVFQSLIAALTEATR